MTKMMNDLLDTHIYLNRLLWILDDVTFDSLLVLTVTHSELVKEALDTNTTLKRKVEIRRIFDGLRVDRDNLINEFKKKVNL